MKLTVGGSATNGTTQSVLFFIQLSFLQYREISNEEIDWKGNGAAVSSQVWICNNSADRGFSLRGYLVFGVQLNRNCGAVSLPNIPCANASQIWPNISQETSSGQSVRSFINIFKESALGRFFHRVAMSVYISVYISIYISVCPLFM